VLFSLFGFLAVLGIFTSTLFWGKFWSLS